MRVSVLLPVFNAEPTLPAAVESILGQSFADFELILIDDGSRDASPDLIRAYARRDARVRAVINPENAGLIRRLNEGLRLAQSPLVARMDSDDEALPERLRVQVDFMERYSDVAVAGSWVFHMGATLEWDRLVRLPYTGKQIAQTLPRENCLYHPSVMLRRELVLKSGGYRAEFPHAEDYELWLRLSRHHRLANIPQPLLRYRLSHGGVTFSKRWDLLRSVYLAQEVFQHPDQPLDQLAPAAEMRLASTHRSKFFANVVRTSVEEPVLLHCWEDARTLIEKCRAEIPAALASELRAQVMAEERASRCAPSL
jgi:glycosyltransferase involved in cell wall biosynthesis